MTDLTDVGPGKLRVLALTRYGRLGASSRMRSFQYLPYLLDHGIEVTVSPLFRDEYLQRLYAKLPTSWAMVATDYFKQALRLLTSSQFDLVWIEKEIFPSLPAWVESAFARLGIKYIVDYDDAIFHNYDLSNNPLKRMLSLKIDSIMRNAALVVCGNDYLAERAIAAGARSVEIVPTVIDLLRYSVPPASEHSKIVIGWIGSPSTAKYLELLQEVLAELSLQLPLQLRVIGAEVALRGVDVLCTPWSEETESDQIRQFDIGIMPLLDSPWERGKCGYKLIQYMACGVPVIASPVGVNNKLVTDGLNGFHAKTSADWKVAINALARDPDMRARMGRAGRSAVELEFCIQVTSVKIAQLFRDAAVKGGR